MCRRVMGKTDDQHLGLRPRLSGGHQQAMEEVALSGQRDRTEIPSGNDDGVGMNGIGGIGNKDNVSGAEGG